MLYLSLMQLITVALETLQKAGFRFTPGWSREHSEREGEMKDRGWTSAGWEFLGQCTSFLSFLLVNLPTFNPTFASYFFISALLFVCLFVFSPSRRQVRSIWLYWNLNSKWGELPLPWTCSRLFIMWTHTLPHLVSSNLLEGEIMMSLLQGGGGERHWGLEPDGRVSTPLIFPMRVQASTGGQHNSVIRRAD